MPVLQQLATTVRQLAVQLPRAADRAATAIMYQRPLRAEPWYGVLENKLLPQLVGEPYLVVAIVGGTNIGKTTIFNHLAGAAVNEASAQAAFTKHPVCLVPTGFNGRHPLSDVFPNFVVRERQHESESREESTEDRLYWQEGPSLPANVLLLDTPDINSVAADNPRRAQMIRQAADVLVAVLTAQNHNDAVVKKFFRSASATEEDQTVIVVFSQVDLAFDEAEWPGWMEKFLAGTEITPAAVFLVPRDRAAALNLSLTFTPRNWPTSPPSATMAAPGAAALEKVLSELNLEAIKLRSLRGALRQLIDEQDGLPHWLRDLQHASGDYSRALRGQSRVAETVPFPVPPQDVLQSIIRRCRQRRRRGVLAWVQNGYDLIGAGASWTIQQLGRTTTSSPEEAMREYGQRERDAMLAILEQQCVQLEMRRDDGPARIRPRLQELLHGQARAQLFNDFRAAHERVNLAEEFDRVVTAEFDKFCQTHPEWDRFYARLDQVLAVVRPVISISLLVAGPFSMAGDVATQVAIDFAAGAVLDQATMRQWYSAVARSWGESRREWFQQWQQATPLGQLERDLKAGADFASDETVYSVMQGVESIRKLIGTHDTTGAAAWH